MKLTKNSLLGLTLALTVTGALTACGSDNKSSDKISKAEFIAKADKICADSKAQTAKIQQPTTDIAKAKPADLKGPINGYFKKILVLQHQQIKKIRDLGDLTTAKDNTLKNTTLAAAEKTIALSESVADAAADGNLKEFKKRLNAVPTTAADAQRKAKQFGFKVCGS